MRCDLLQEDESRDHEGELERERSFEFSKTDCLQDFVMAENLAD